MNDSNSKIVCVHSSKFDSCVQENKSTISKKELKIRNDLALIKLKYILYKSKLFYGCADETLNMIILNSQLHFISQGQGLKQAYDQKDIVVLTDDDVMLENNNLDESIFRIIDNNTLDESEHGSLPGVFDTNMIVLIIPHAFLLSLKVDDKVFNQNLRQYLLTSLRQTNDLLSQKINDSEKYYHRLMSCVQLLVMVVLSLSVFAGLISLSLSIKIVPSYINMALLFFLSIATALTIRKSRLPLSYFGLSTHRIKEQTCLALEYTMTMLAILICFKAMLISFAPGFQNHKLLNVNFYPPHFMWFLYIILLAPAQEFVTRCGLQKFICLLFEKSTYAVVGSIVLSSLLFSVIHILYSWQIFAISLASGLYWGYVFHKTKSFYAVAISHSILGTFVFGALGIV